MKCSSWNDKTTQTRLVIRHDEKMSTCMTINSPPHGIKQKINGKRTKRLQAIRYRWRQPRVGHWSGLGSGDSGPPMGRVTSGPMECCCRRWRSRDVSVATECDKWESHAATWVSQCSSGSDVRSASEIIENNIWELTSQKGSPYSWYRMLR